MEKKRVHCKNERSFDALGKKENPKIGSYFLNLMGKHFLPHHNFHKLFNRSKINIS